MRRKCIGILSGLIITLCNIRPVAAADSLSVSLDEADSIFLAKNFTLLAQHCQVNADEAIVRQARLWNNPSFSAELGMHTLSRPRFLDIGPGGETSYSIDQVIRIAGQRNKNIRVAVLHRAYSEATFDELIRTLKLQLHSSFFTLFYKRQSLAVLSEQEAVLDDIIKAYRQADMHGSVAHADFIRLQALQLSLKNDYLSLLQDALTAQQELQQLLGTDASVVPQLDTAVWSRYHIDQYSLSQLLDTARAARPDIKMAALDGEGARANYTLQKALAVPDLHVGATYDKQGSYVSNYWGLTAGIDLPLWNRNQGNIRAARSQLLQSEIKMGAAQNVAETEVERAFRKVKAYEQSFRQPDLEAFDNEYKNLIESVAENFTKGNISLLQFIDYFNSYSDNVKDLNAYQAGLYGAYEELAFAVGINLY